MPNNTHYNDNDIQLLEELEGVRKRPGMYIGSVDSRGVHHLLWEIISNSVDEALAGFGSEIIVHLYKDNSIEVTDFGRGIPVGMHKSGLPTPIVVFTKLHAGGKFSDTGGYITSGGLHGVGAAVVNALSEEMIVTITRDNKIYQVSFTKGKVKDDFKQIDITTSKKSGTVVHFKPDSTIFSTTHFNHNTIVERLRETAFLLPGFKIVFKDDISGTNEEFIYEKGLEDFVNYNVSKKEKLHDVVTINGMSDKISVSLAFVYTNDFNDDPANTMSFVNNVRTIDGGTHESGMRSAFTKAFNEAANDLGILAKNKISALDGHDVREGLNVVLSVLIPSGDMLQFESQTKSKLGSPLAKTVVESIVFEKLSYYLKEHKDIATTLINKCIGAYKAREASRKAKEEVRKGKNVLKQDRIISDKLAPAQSKNSDVLELFLVEGDSAGGSAKQGRNSKYQSILPLRGKVINSEKNKISELLKNEEINTIIYTIGAGLGDDFNYRQSNYNKIIIMTDADTDGSHIQVLLLTFFFRYMRGLLENGMVYVALPPLYKVYKKTSKGEIFKYAWNDEDLAAAKEEIGEHCLIQRYKGLGEMNPDQLWETTMNPQTRTLLRVTINDFARADSTLNVLMGDDSEIRRNWIEENVNFTLEDNFTKED